MTLIWEANHEAGDLSEWLQDQDEFSFNKGIAQTALTQDHSHSGSYALDLSVWGIDKPGNIAQAEAVRWAEHLTEGRYSARLMFPVLPEVKGWLNIFQFLKKNPDTGLTQPTWYNEIIKTPEGPRISLTEFKKNWEIPPNACPSPVLEAGRWFELKWLYKDGVDDGELKIWIDNELIWAFKNVNTRGQGPDIQWGINCYGTDVGPCHVQMIADDCRIEAL